MLFSGPGRRLAGGPASLQALALALALAWSPHAFAEMGSLSGVVTDAAGRPVAGVEVDLAEAGRGKVAGVVSDRAGRFTLPPAKPGSYSLRAARPGYATVTETVTMPAPAARPLSIVLEPLQPTVVETLTVRARAFPAGPTVSLTGSGDYAVSADDILGLPAAANTTMTDVLAQMPGVAIDQNQQIHIRDTEGPQFQYQINGALVPLDINTNPPFISMINPQFVRRLDLLDGVLPARYGFATGGVVDIETKDGCDETGGSVGVMVGQLQTFQPTVQYGGCAGRFGYYVSGLYDQGQTAFSSATPGPTPIHDYTRQGQGFGYFSYALGPTTRLSLTLSAAASDNQLPNVPGLAPQFTLAGVTNYASADINSYLDFRDYLAILALSGSPSPNLIWQIDYAFHSISQTYLPDDAGELIFQGVASRALHRDLDDTLEGDLTYRIGPHTFGAGFYTGLFDVDVSDASLVFPVNPQGVQSSSTPIQVISTARAMNFVLGIYLDDLWRITDRLRADFGVRFDALTGFTNHAQIDPTVNISYDVDDRTTLHAGGARYMQVPSFQGISPGAPAAFAGTTAAGPPGVASPLTEDDHEADVGLVSRLGGGFSVSEDNYYERTDHYLDTGQFGVVPIFAPFNYSHGYIWGSELALKFRGGGLSAYANLTVGRNEQTGVVTGQFNFDPAELAYIDSHYIVLDHQPLFGASAGAVYAWRAWSFSFDAIYSSGLRAGFADEVRLPTVFQVNAAVQRAFAVPIVGKVIDRVTVLDLFDRVNLIRPAEGIGIFQSAYGPRFTLLDQIIIPF
jgi:hypothetical protein